MTIIEQGEHELKALEILEAESPAWVKSYVRSRRQILCDQLLAAKLTEKIVADRLFPTHNGFDAYTVSMEA